MSIAPRLPSRGSGPELFRVSGAAGVFSVWLKSPYTTELHTSVTHFFVPFFFLPPFLFSLGLLEEKK